MGRIQNKYVIAPADHDPCTAVIARPYPEVISLRKPGLRNDIAEALPFFALDASRPALRQALAIDDCNTLNGRDETEAGFLRTNQ